MGRSTCDTAARRAALAALLLGTLLPGAVHAKELKLPADHPMVAMDVPDDWSIDTTPVAVEMKAPEKNAIVVAKVIEAQKATAEAFSKQAVAALQAFGVTFAKKTATPAKTPTAAAPAKTAADKTATNQTTADKTAAASTPQSKLAAAGLSSFNGKTDSFTFTGAPSLAIPGTSGSNNQEKTPPNSVESLTGFGATITGAQKLPLRAAQYFGTTLDGRPVDVQFVLFRLPDNKHFLAMMQESGGDDGRTVAMAQSVKAVK